MSSEWGISILPSALNLRSLIRTQGVNDFSVLDGIVLLKGDSVKRLISERLV